ncbi:DUF2201 family putative metallopeptidase [Anaerotardibacter muris]|uniref:vWA domain-containing protein n=1 Tax=Anaerotardibacter muris TaxID=2941505 RepID=UPI00203BEC80|nr:VWA-like domain-containing protein [Anaerotardibacter muris]
MVLSESDTQEYIRRLLLSRMRILNDHPFFGLLLMHMRYAIDEAASTAYTDGERIVFGADFLQELSDSELDFVMLHEIMHVVLQHCWRAESIPDHDLFNIACDIVVNSNILLENGLDLESISLHGHGVSMHVAPNGKEGYEYTAEQVYEMFPRSPQDGGFGQNGLGCSGESDQSDNKNDGQGQDPSKGQDQSQSQGWHGDSDQNNNTDKNGSSGFSDDHSHWGSSGSGERQQAQEVWIKRILDAEKAIRVREESLGRGLMPALVERCLGELRQAQTDWRVLLSEFIQFDVNDYSFTPPDRRMMETPFFLPDFNSAEEVVRNVLFMVDTSGSITDEMMTVAFSEVKGALEQFSDSLEGWLGYFDAEVVEPVRFDDVEGLAHIQPRGGGGTSFLPIFEYVEEKMADEPPVCIIILTDGYAPFPPEEVSMDIPVIWLISNNKVTPPWGRVARFRV